MDVKKYYVLILILIVLCGIGVVMYGINAKSKAAKKQVVVLFGVPGTGKSTQGKMLEKELNMPHISTGDLLRGAVAKETVLGMRAKEYMNRGDLVPDSLVVEILKDRISEDDCNKGFLLDGFPRNVAQIEILDNVLREEGFSITSVVNIDISMEEAVRRLSGRRVCPDCGDGYHVENMPPKEPGICDKCQGELIQRKDDSKEVIEKRFLAYEENTVPVKVFYSKRGILYDVEGERDLNVIYDDILAIIKKSS